MSGAFTRYGNLFFEWAPIRFLDTTALKVWMVIYNKADIPGLWQVDLPDVASKSFLTNEQTMRALDELRDRELAEFDRQNRILRLTQFPDAGEWPSGPKIMYSWWKLFTTRMPDCDVRNAHVTLLRWLLDEGARESKHPNATGRPSDLHEEIWSATFGIITPPVGRSIGARAFSDADTSTAKQPSLFGVRGGISGVDGIPKGMGSLMGSGWDPPPSVNPSSEAPILESSRQVPPVRGSHPKPVRDPIGDPIGDGVGAGSGDGPRLAEVIVLDPSSTSRARPIGPARDEIERDRKVSAVVRAVHHEHVLAFNRVKADIGSRAFGPELMEDPRLLRELVRGMVNLDTAEERCRYAIEVQEHEAREKNTLTYFGASMWKPDNFDKALTYDLPGQLPVKVRAPAAATGSAFAAAASYFDERRRKETTS